MRALLPLAATALAAWALAGCTSMPSAAELDREASTTSSECMRVHALASANGARFSSAANAPQPQRGTITYLFLAQ